MQQVGQRLKLPHHVFVITARDDASGPRLGITASRKVGSAVVRNRAKRLIREAFRTNKALFPADIDVVVIVRDAPENQRLADVVAEWRSAERALRGRIEQARRARRAALRDSEEPPPPRGRC